MLFTSNHSSQSVFNYLPICYYVSIISCVDGRVFIKFFLFLLTELEILCRGRDVIVRSVAHYFEFLFIIIFNTQADTRGKQLTSPTKQQSKMPFRWVCIAGSLAMCMSSTTPTPLTTSQEQVQMLNQWTKSLSKNIDDSLRSVGLDQIVTSVQNAVTNTSLKQVEGGVQTALSELSIKIASELGNARNVLRDLHNSVDQMSKAGSADTHYWDADGFTEMLMPGGLRAGVPKTMAQYAKTSKYAADVNFEQASVVLSTKTIRENPLVSDFIEWSARLDDVFQKKRYKSDKILYQYVGDVTGAMRLYPGRNWQRNIVGAPKTFDMHSRPWYTSVKSGAKDVVFVVDGSSSMGLHRIWSHRVYKLLKRLLGHLSERDNVAVIITGASYRDIVNNWWFRNPAEVLSCDGNLMPATNSRKSLLLNTLKNYVPRGGTRNAAGFRKAFSLLKERPLTEQQQACSQAVVFITDDDRRDPDAFCGAGSYSENGVWEPANPCDYSLPENGDVFNELKDTVANHTFNGTIFSYKMRGAAATVEHARSLACAKGKGTFKRIGTQVDIDEAEQRFNAWLQYSTISAGQRWTSPYLDESGTGKLIVTVSQAFNKFQSFGGVAAVDVLLSDIRDMINSNMLEDGLWDYSYPFLINDKGEAIIHPYLDYRETDKSSEDPVWPPIEELEMTLSNGIMSPRNFITIRDNMLAGQTGTVTISNGVTKRTYLGGHKHGYTENPVRSKTYSYIPIKNTPFFLCIVVVDATASFKEFTANSPFRIGGLSIGNNVYPAALHNRLDLYTAEELLESSPSGSPRRKSGNSTRQISTTTMSYYIPPECMCNIHDYRFTTISPGDMKNMDTQVNVDFHATPPICEAQHKQTYQIHSRCIADVRKGIEFTYEPWKRILTDTQLSQWVLLDREEEEIRYISNLGTMITKPGGMIPLNYNAKEQPWYKAAISDTSITHVTSPRYHQVSGVGTLTISKAIVAASDSPGVYRGVVSMDVKLSQWNIENTREFGPDASASISRFACGQGYQCDVVDLSGTSTKQQCETRCYIVDSSSMVLWNSSSSWPEANRTLEVPLGEGEGELFRQLLYSEGTAVFSRSEYNNHQGQCPVAQSYKTNYYRKYDLETDWNGNIDLVRSRRQQVPPFASIRTCPTIDAFYTLNRDVLNTPKTGTIKDGCDFGEYSISLIPNTNAAFIIINNYYSIQSRQFDATGNRRPPTREFGCKAKNAIHTWSTPASNYTCAFFEPTHPLLQPVSETTTCASVFPPTECQSIAALYEED